jgi:transcriptional regulator NrdR family protein
LDSQITEGGIMICPICDSINLKVFNTKRYETKQYRRRKCLECDYRFTTYEVDTALLMELFEEQFDLDTISKISTILEREFPAKNEWGGVRR